MATGKASDFVIYDEQFFGGYTEVLQQQSRAFGEASNGALVLVPQVTVGEYEKESFFKAIAALVTRRDTTSVATAEDTPLVQGENVAVKLNRKIGPVAQTIDSFRKIGRGSEEISFIIGQQMGQAVALDYLNTALAAAVPAFGQTYQYDGSAATPNHAGLISGLAKFGDAAGNIVCWVMHSASFFGLMQQAVADKIFEVAGVTLYQGTIPTLNRPVLVTDSPALITDGSPDNYHILGLTRDAVVVKESEERQVVSAIITGLENLVVRIQGEYAFNLSLKGYAWDTTSGGVNPSASAVATASNWDKIVSDDRNTGGVDIVVR